MWPWWLVRVRMENVSQPEKGKKRRNSTTFSHHDNLIVLKDRISSSLFCESKRPISLVLFVSPSLDEL